jgi:hypothetical protein
MSQPHQLPPLETVLTWTPDLGTPDPLHAVLSLLYEPSPVLTAEVVPRVRGVLPGREAPSYTSLLGCVGYVVMNVLPAADRAAFIAGHPRIGEVKNLSAMSASEQARQAASPEVLARLAHLNACYEHRYPGLVYITFVNGRSRAAIAEEMEDRLGIAHSLSPDDPPISDNAFEPIPMDSPEWNAELGRAVQDVSNIALRRLLMLHVL